MDSSQVSADTTSKQHAGFTMFALFLCLSAVTLGLIDSGRGYVRVLPICASAGSACYFANRLWPNRLWVCIGVSASMAAIVVFFIR